ncbi:hypothetical protein BU24DRAFT_428672 [Aaosphaeria arxii CBS 175.79]|uniref:DNA replication factor Cdt1 C-terminal domain-containing protein n=1 Tax=Aaosphaeria arxii CBS 175.79 TaxID=1450172 RepID=A0A6A5X8C5_9PLEO|nr:uncharacterized protein BU24DRAFT_428672 [Aaosphaeria arxii CBS 175.79]KAF2009150.1 hypothetical protein BU24DRAFT_428672 [Aaosphaeria arxii CBS 175.79]
MAPAAATLPAELVDLLSLHSSFLTALSLYYAHNGTATPADLRELAPSISAIWQKRKVTFDDIRLCVGVLGAGPAGNRNPFYLSDYTQDKVCLEISDDYKMGAMGALNEDALQAMFMENLDHLWRVWSDSRVVKLSPRPIATPKRRARARKAGTTQTMIQSFVDENTISKFLSHLPQAEITLCSSAAAVAPLREKGRKRLREFQDIQQHGRSQKKSRESTGKENEPAILNTQSAQPKITEFASVRKSNLLDRILAKQEAAKAGPTPPSPAELQRRAALQRSEEVLGVLSLLAASKGPGGRVSFSMAALLQSIQSSIRTPLSKDEVLKCVEVLANEVTPGYVSVLRMGAISSVIINSSLRPVDVKSRLVALGAA